MSTGRQLSLQTVPLWKFQKKSRKQASKLFLHSLQAVRF